MPKRPDPRLKTESGIYLSQKRQNEKFDETVEKIIVRVPGGTRDAINKYVEAKATADPTNLKYNSYNGKAYRPSVNALIRNLIEAEMGINLDSLYDKE